MKHSGCSLRNDLPLSDVARPGVGSVTRLECFSHLCPRETHERAADEEAEAGNVVGSARVEAQTSRDDARGAGRRRRAARRAGGAGRCPGAIAGGETEAAVAEGYFEAAAAFGGDADRDGNRQLVLDSGPDTVGRAAPRPWGRGVSGGLPAFGPDERRAGTAIFPIGDGVGSRNNRWRRRPGASAGRTGGRNRERAVHPTVNRP